MFSKKHRLEFSRSASAGLGRALCELRQGAFPELSPEAFVQGLSECLGHGESRDLIVEHVRAYCRADLPHYVSKPEPRAETDAARKLFPQAHAGNLRRLIEVVYRSPEAEPLSPSTRAYVILNMLIYNLLSSWTSHSYKAFGRYLNEELHIADEFENGYVHRYWRHLPQASWGRAEVRANAPKNAEAVMHFARHVQRCICSGGTDPDERLFKM